MFDFPLFALDIVIGVEFIYRYIRFFHMQSQYRRRVVITNSTPDDNEIAQFVVANSIQKEKQREFHIADSPEDSAESAYAARKFAFGVSYLCTETSLRVRVEFIHGYNKRV